MNTAVKQVTFEFISDNVSTAMVQNLTLPPVSADFTGSPVLSVFDLTVTNAQSVTVPASTAAITAAGVLTITFASAPLQFDTSMATVIYTATFFISIQ